MKCLACSTQLDPVKDVSPRSGKPVCWRCGGVNIEGWYLVPPRPKGGHQCTEVAPPNIWFDSFGMEYVIVSGTNPPTRDTIVDSGGGHYYRLDSEVIGPDAIWTYIS